jgi:hypothetical protein
MAEASATYLIPIRAVNDLMASFFHHFVWHGGT